MDSESDGAFDLPPVTIPAPPVVPETGDREHFPREKPQELNVFEGEIKPTPKEAEVVKIRAADEINKLQEYQDDEEIEPPAGFGYVKAPSYIGLVEKPVDVDASIEATLETTSLDAPPAEYATEEIEEKLTKQLLVEETGENADQDAAPGLVNLVLEEAKGNVEGQLVNNLIEKHFIIEPEGLTERLDAPEFSSGATVKVEELLEPASAKELGPDPEKAIEAFEQSPADEMKPEEQPEALKTKAELGLAETIEKFQETAETSTVEEPELVVKGTEVPSVEAEIEEEKPIKQPEANEEGFAAESVTEAVADREEELDVIPAESIVEKVEEEGEAKKTVAVATSSSEAAVEQLEELEANLKVQEDGVGEEKESSLAEATEVEKVDSPIPEEEELLGKLETKETADVIESSIRDASEAIPVNEEEELVQERDISLVGFTEFKGQTKVTEATDVAEFSPEPTEKAAETLEAIDLTQEAAEPRAVEEPELVVVKGTEVPSVEAAIEEEKPIEYLEAKEEAFAAESLAEDVADPEEELDENQAGSRTEVEEEAGAKETVAIAESSSEAVVEKLEEVGADPNVPEEGVGDEKETLLAKATEDETLVPAPVEQELGGELDTKETADVTVSSITDASEAIPVKGEALLVQGRDISLVDFTEEKASESSHAKEEFKGQTEAMEAIKVAESSPEPTEKATETLEAIDIGQETAETSAVEEPELATSKETEVSKGEAATEEEKPIEQQPEAYVTKSQAELVTDPDEGLNGTIAVSILEKVGEEPGVKVTVATAESSSEAAIEQQELEDIPKAEENGAGEEKETLLAEATEDNKLDVPAPVEEELGELETKETTDGIESSIKDASEVISVKGEEELEQGRDISLADFTQEKTSESSPAAEELKGQTQATEAIAVAASSPEPTEKAAETLEPIDIGQETAEASAVKQPELAVSKETAISSGEVAIEEKKPVELPEVKEEAYAAKSMAELVTDSDEAIDGKPAESGTEKAEEEAEAKEATAIAELSSEAAVEQLEQLEANPDVEDEGVSEEKETLAAEAMEDEKLDVLTPVEEELRGELETKETIESADVIESSIKDASEAIPDKGEALLVQGRDISQSDFTEEITSESSPAEEESKEQTEATEAIEVAESSTESTEKAAETLEAIDRGQETAEISAVKEPELAVSKETEVSSGKAAIEEEKPIEQPETKEEAYAAKSPAEVVTDLDEGVDEKVAGSKTEEVEEEPEVRETVATAESSSEAAIEQQEELEGIPNVEEYGTGEEKETLLATENQKLDVPGPVEEELGGELETKANADGIEPSIEEASEAIPVREEEEAVQERDISLADVSGEKTSEPSLAEDKLKGQTEATEVIKVAESSSEPTEKAAETLEAIDIGQETAETSAVEEPELVVSKETEVSSEEAAIEEEKPIEQPEVKEEAYATKSLAEVVTDLDEGVDEKVAGSKTEEVEEEPEVKETVAIAELSSEAAVEQLDDLETNLKVQEEGAREEKETLVAEATQNEKLDVPAPAEEEIGAELKTKAKADGIEPSIQKIPEATPVKGEEEVVQERDISPADFSEDKTQESSPAKEEFKGESEATEAIEVAESAPEPTEKVAETLEASGELEEVNEKAEEKPKPPQVEKILEESAESGEASEAADASVETTENIEEETEAIHDVEEVKLKDTLGAGSSLEEKVKAPQADEEVELTKASDIADSSLEATAEAEAVSEEAQEQELVKDEENVAAESTGEVKAEVVPVGVKEEEESQPVETTEPDEQSPEAIEKTAKLAEAAEEQETVKEVETLPLGSTIHATKVEQGEPSLEETEIITRNVDVLETGEVAEKIKETSEGNKPVEEQKVGDEASATTDAVKFAETTETATISKVDQVFEVAREALEEEKVETKEEQVQPSLKPEETEKITKNVDTLESGEAAEKIKETLEVNQDKEKLQQETETSLLEANKLVEEPKIELASGTTDAVELAETTEAAEISEGNPEPEVAKAVEEDKVETSVQSAGESNAEYDATTIKILNSAETKENAEEIVDAKEAIEAVEEKQVATSVQVASEPKAESDATSINVAESAASTEKAEEIDEAREVKAETSNIETDKVIAEEALELPSKVRAKSEVTTTSVPESTESAEKAGGVVEATEATEDAQEEKVAYLVEEASEPKIESDATTNVLESVEATEKAEEIVEAREVKVGTPEIETDKEVTEEEVLEHPSEEKAKADVQADSTTTIGVHESAELAEKANKISEEKEEPVSHAQAGEQPSVEVAQAIEETKAEELFEEKEGSEEVKSAETLPAEPGEGDKEKVETSIETEEELQEQTLEDEASGTTDVVKVAATTEAAETSVGNQEPEVAKETAEEEKVETSVQVAGELNVESDATTTDVPVSPEPNKKAEEILQATEAIEEEKGTTAVEVADDSNVKADATTTEVPHSAESTEKTAIVEATEAVWGIEEEKGATSVPVADETKVEYDATTNVLESGDSTEKAVEIVKAREVKVGTPEIETDEVTEEEVLEHPSKVKAKADATTTIGVDESVKLAEKANEISEEKEEPVSHAQAGEKPSVEVAQAIEETKAEEHFEEKEGSEEVKSAETLPAEPTEGVKEEEKVESLIEAEVEPQADAETTTNVIASEFREVAENTEEEKEVNKEKENLEESETQLLESHKLKEEEPKVIEDAPKSNKEVELVETTETAKISEEKQEPEEVKKAIEEDKLETLAKAAGKQEVETDAASIVVPESAESTEKAEETVEARELKVEDTTENETAGKVVEEQVLEPSGAVTTDSNVETDATPAIDVAESTETNEKEISEQLEEPVPQTQGNEEQEVKRSETAEGIQAEEQFGETQGSEEVISSETKLEEPEEGVTEEKKQEPSSEVEEKSKAEERQVDAETTTKVDVLESGEDTENTAETLAVNKDQEKLDEIETSELESNQLAEEEPNVEDKAPETETSSSNQEVEEVVEAEKEEKLESSTQAVDEEKAETRDTQTEEYFKGKEESEEVISAETLSREPTEGVKEEKKVETSIEAEEKLKEEETQADTETTTNATEEAVEVSQEKEKLEESETQLLESNKLVEGEPKVIEEVPESNNEVELAETTETVKVSEANQEADKVKEAIEEDKLETLAQAEVGTDAPTSNVPESAESDEKAEEIVETREVKVPETLIETADEVAEEQAVEPSSEVKADLKAETDATIAIDVSDSTETKEREISEENADLVPQTHGDEEKEVKRQEAVKKSQAEEQIGEIQGSEEVVSAETTLADSNTEEQQVDAETTTDVGVIDSGEVTENTEGTLEMNKEQEKLEEMETPQLESNKLAEEVPKVEDKAPETTEIVELAESTEAAKTSDSNQEVEEAIVAEKEEKLESSAQAVEEAKVETGATATDVHESLESTKKVEDILEEAEVKEEGTIENETATEVLQEAAPEPLSHVVPESKKEADATTESAEEISETVEKTREITKKDEEPVPHTQANEEPEFEVPEATEGTPAKEPLEEHEAEEVKDTETSSVELTEGVKEGEKLKPSVAVDEEPREVGVITIDASEAAAEATEQVKETIEATTVEEPEQEMVKEREFSETPVEEEAIKDQSEATEVIEAESKQTTIDAIESIEATEKVLEIPEETQELVSDTKVEEESNIDLPEATGKTPELLEEQEGPEEVKATQTLLVEHTEGAKEDEEPEPTIEVKEEPKDINVSTTVDSEAAAEATEQAKETIEATTAGELEQEVVKEREFSQIPAEEEIQDQIPHDEKTLKDQYEATEVTEADSKEATTVDATESTEATTIDAPESTQASEKVKEISEETEVLTHDTQADELSKVKVPEATEKTLIEELPEEKTEAEGIKSIENLSAELTEGVTEERKIEQSVIAEEPKEVDVNTTVAVIEASDETIDATNIDEIEQEVVKDRDISPTSEEDDKQEQAPQQGEALLDQSEATEIIEAENKESTTIDVAESVQATENPKDISELTEELVPHTQEKTESEGVESTEIMAAELTEVVTEKGKIEQSVIAEEPKEVDVNTIVAVTEASDATTDQVKETIDATNIDETEKEVVKDRDFSLTSAEDDQQEQAPQQGEAPLDQSEATEVIEAENKESTTLDAAESVQATEKPKDMSEVTEELVTRTQVAEKLNNEILETAEAAKVEEPLEEIEGSKEAISAETLAPEPMEGVSKVEKLEGFEQVQEEPKDFDVITTASTEASAEATDQVKEVIEEASNDEELEEEEPKEVDVITATSSIQALAQETNQVKEVIAASNDEKLELEAVKDRDFSQISEEVDQEQIHQQGEAAKDQSIAIEVLEADSKETATVDTVESTEATEKTQEILGGAEEAIPRTQAAKEPKVEIQEATEETKAEEFWEEIEESGKVKGTDTLPKEQTEQIVEEEKLEPASEVQEESKEAGITMIAATAAAAEETELERETTDTAIVGEKGQEFGKEREFSLTSAEEEQQELAGEVQEKSKGVDITTIAAPAAAADDTERVNETTDAAIVREAKQELVTEREFSETSAEEVKQELASEVQDKSKEVDITTIATTAAAADETELAKGTAKAAILGESEQELVKEREFPEASAGVEQQEQAPQQGETLLDQSEAPKVIDAESKELIDGVTKETGIFPQDAEKAGEIAEQAGYSGKKETQENQETAEKTRLEESSKELIEGERVKEFVKEAVVEEGKPLLEAKNDKAEEEKLEDSAPTNELVQQATEQVENKITTFPTKEVPKSITDAVIVSRDVEFIPETKQENILKEPQSEHKDSEANDESPDEDHEEPHAKHKHSQNIFSKVKQSFVKAKKAIIGKHPKPASSETKENQS